MKIDGNEWANFSQPRDFSPVYELADQHHFERYFDRVSLADRPQGKSIEDLHAELFSLKQRDQLWQNYLLDDKAVGVAEQLFRPVISKLVERFGERQLPMIETIDLRDLRDLMLEFDLLSSRRETVLVNVIAEFKDMSNGPDYLIELARRELLTLIPQNSIVSNLVKHTHKPDLEE